MWYITSPTGERIYVVQKNTFTIGRKNSDILIENDESISRNHAKITYKDGDLFVTDLGSKYGTCIGETKLRANEDKEIHNGMEIKFGALHSKYKFTNIPINIYRSNISTSEKSILAKHMNYLNGKILKEWSSECTYLVTSTVKLTSKVLCALIEGKHIVNIAFWNDFVKSVERNLKLPNPSNYLPELNEALLSKNVPLVYKPERKTLFAGKIFAFFSLKVMQGIQDVIHLAGGKAILWKKKASLNLDVFESTNPEYIVIQDCDKEFQSQAEAFEDYNNIMKHLSTISKRSIPLQEIALAILHCSCEKNCNPNFDRMKALIHSEKSAFTESQILALNTESVSQVFIANTQNSVSETPLDKINISPIKNTQQTDSIDIMNVEEVSETQRSATLSHLEDSGPKKTKENETDSMRTISDIPSCSSSNKRAIDQVDAALEPRKCEKVKKIKVDETKNVNPFTFKYKRQEVYPEKTESEKQTNSCESKSMVVNPLTQKKRKAETELEKTRKKSAMSDIMNITVSGDPFLSSKEIFSSTAISDSRAERENIHPNIEKKHSTTIPVTGWISKRNCNLKKSNQCEGNLIKKENTDETIKWMQSFTDKIIVEFKKLEVDKPKVCNLTKTGGKNFKKFRKIPPKYVQSRIIPKSAYTVVVCGDEDMAREFNEESEEEELSDFEEVPSVNMSSLIMRRKTVTVGKKFNFG